MFDTLALELFGEICNRCAIIAAIEGGTQVGKVKIQRKDRLR